MLPINGRVVVQAASIFGLLHSVPMMVAPAFAMHCFWKRRAEVRGEVGIMSLPVFFDIMILISLVRYTLTTADDVHSPLFQLKFVGCRQAS